MTTLYQTMLGFGILVIVGLLFAVLLLAVRKGQKPSRMRTNTSVPPRKGRACPACSARNWLASAREPGLT